MAGWLIFADDLTGACDTGAVFAQAGLSTRVLLDLAAHDQAGGLPEGGVLVITTGSRHLPAWAAAQAVELAVAHVVIDPGAWIYKKVDSTLRGQPGPELAALMAWLGEERALVAPAFPAQGRTVQDGSLLVNGRPLAETVFGYEGISGKLEDAFAAAGLRHRLGLESIRRGAGWVAGELTGAGTWLADTETEEDLRILAAAARQSGLRLLCGSAGLARAVIGENKAGGAGTARKVREKPAASGWPVLVVAGSQHPVTLRQISAAEQAGLQVNRPGGEVLRIANLCRVDLAELLDMPEKGQSLVVSSEDMSAVPGQEVWVAEGLAKLACAALARMDAPVGLVLTGGDTAAAVCRNLHCRVITLGGEICPGMGWGWLEDGQQPGLLVATKAGGFGGEDALVAAVEFLRKISVCGER